MRASLLKETITSLLKSVVEKLREQGFAERTANEDDRRMVVVTITEKGLEMVAEIGELVLGATETLPGQQLTETELTQLAELLDKIRE